MKKTISGFTIVELLIVIVVIAILAAISVVAYTNIQNRAYDSAVQNDMTNFAKKVQLIAADTGDYPAGGARRSGGINVGDSTSFPGFTFSPTKSAYLPTVANLNYCTGADTGTGQKIFRVVARSRSGNAFQYSSNNGPESLGNISVGSTTACQDLDETRTWAYGYNHTGSGTWWNWTN